MGYKRENRLIAIFYLIWLEMSSAIAKERKSDKKEDIAAP
jgi:hypothetical protein